MANVNGTNDSPYEVRKSAVLGRYLVATRDLAPGDVVLSERPLVFGPKAMADPEATMPCVGCYKPVITDVGERCAKCGWPVCSGNCPGLTDPKHHGLECEILSARPECVLDNMAEYYRHDALLPLRCLLLQKTDPQKWRQLLDMQSHMECRGPGTEVYEETDEFIVEYLMNNFIKNLDGSTKIKYIDEITPELIHRICGIIETNALEIRLNEGAEMFALYAKTCLMEHSCIPNTKHTFVLSGKDRDDIFKITMKTVVPVLKGENISTMYSHALWGTQARRQHLKDTKYFDCTCPRCSDPTELGTYLSAMRCLGDGTNPCEGIHLPIIPIDVKTEWQCSKCGVTVYNAEINIIIAQMGEEVDNVLMMGDSVMMLEKLLCRLSIFLHPNHYHLYTIKHSLVQLYGRQAGYSSVELLDRKIKMCKELIAVTKALDPGNARLSLYSSVLQNELHSALVMRSNKANSDGNSMTDDEVKSLLIEAKTAIEEALGALDDDVEESAGKKLYSVIEETKRNFEKYCKEKNLVI